MIKLIQGSIFDSKCDLLIIPCNQNGEVSVSVEESLLMHNLYPYGRVFTPGDIDWNYTNTGVVGYAASVDTHGEFDTANNVRVIANKIFAYCKENMLRKINVPLLGTGAGGLSEKESYEIMYETFAQVPTMELCVYVLSPSVYYSLQEQYMERDIQKRQSINTIAHPRVFISYTGMDDKNAQWVKELADKLRRNGVDARLDKFHLKPGYDLPQWMTDEVIKAQKVLLICDKYYADKADMRRGGVGWETMIIQGDMLANQDQGKYIAIIREPNIDESLPVYVKSKYALDWSDDNKAENGFDELLYHLFDCDTEPPIGEIPDFIKKKLQGQLTTV